MMNDFAALIRKINKFASCEINHAVSVIDVY